LVCLFGAAVGGEAAARLAPLLDRYQEGLPAAWTACRSRQLTPQDALRISHADQVHEPGGPTLQMLADFAHQHLRSLVSEIHLLPFYPWSSDDGFAAKDCCAVEPAYGT